MQLVMNWLQESKSEIVMLWTSNSSNEKLSKCRAIVQAQPGSEFPWQINIPRIKRRVTVDPGYMVLSTDFFLWMWGKKILFWCI